MKIVTVVGARPQFIKAAAISRVIRPEINEILVHTGQHYDQNMSDIFFKELHIPTPDYNLGVGSGSHAKQTGEMMLKIEEILLAEKPDMVLIYGDTNSTLAAAIASVKIHIPIAHVEAGLRSYNMLMPEEVNRILSDRISSMLFCPTETAVANLKAEGLTENVFNVGDVMCDTVLYYGKLIDNYGNDFCLNRLIKIISKVSLPKKWYLATIHRAENTDNIIKIEQILSAFEQLPEMVIFPVHPRSKKLVLELYKKHEYSNILFCEPMGYLDMLYFTKNAIKIITDSGGLQKEAYILDTACVTVRDQTEWIETLIGNNNILCAPNAADILEKVLTTVVDKSLKKNYYGNGNAAEKIYELLQERNNEF